MRKYHAKKAYGGVKVNDAFLILALDENTSQSLRHGLFYPQHKSDQHNYGGRV